MQATDSGDPAVLESRCTSVCSQRFHCFLHAPDYKLFLGAADALPALVNEACRGKLSSTEAKRREAAGTHARKLS